jgi:hypothetical protein
VLLLGEVLAPLAPSDEFLSIAQGCGPAESLSEVHTPGKLLHVFDACGSFHLGNGRDLLEVGFDVAMADDEAE